MHINNENKFEWVRILNDSIGNNYYSVTNISQGIATQNLHFIFSEHLVRIKRSSVNL
jgi:hypothetical protein